MSIRPVTPRWSSINRIRQFGDQPDCCTITLISHGRCPVEDRQTARTSCAHPFSRNGVAEVSQNVERNGICSTQGHGPNPALPKDMMSYPYLPLIAHPQLPVAGISSHAFSVMPQGFFVAPAERCTEFSRGLSERSERYPRSGLSRVPRNPQGCEDIRDSVSGGCALRA